VVAATAFLVGASLLLLGTRLTARIRWALCLPVLALPAVTSRPPIAAALIAVAVIATAAATLRRLRNRHRASEPVRSEPAGRSHPLPSWRLAGAVVAALAVVLAVVAVAPGLGSDPASASHPPAVTQVP